MSDHRPKTCPICHHAFQGNGWDGIDAHWRAKHENIMPYKEAWPLIQAVESNVSEMDDPEASYRRGYQQGAYAALQAVRSTPVAKIQSWVEESCRAGAISNAFMTGIVGPPTRSRVSPPVQAPVHLNRE